MCGRTRLKFEMTMQSERQKVLLSDGIMCREVIGNRYLN